MTFCEGIRKPGGESEVISVQGGNIPSNMLLHKHVDGADTRLSTMEGLFVNNPLGKWLGVTRRGAYQAAPQDSRCGYHPVSALWPDIDSDINSRNDGSSDEGINEQEKLDDQEQVKVVLVPHRNQRRLRWGDQKSLRHI